MRAPSHHRHPPSFLPPLRRLVGALAGATYLARDLITTPAEDLGPQHMVAEARALAAAHPGATIRVVEGEELLVQVRVGGGERGADVGGPGRQGVC